MTKERREEISRAMRGEVRGLYISDDVREIIGDLTAALAWAEQQRGGYRQTADTLRHLLDEAEGCKAILRDERDTAHLDLTALRGEHAARASLLEKYYRENIDLQHDLEQARAEACALRRERDKLKARLMSDQVKTCVATLEGVTGADPPDLQELARTHERMMDQYQAERDEARAKAADAERVIEEISLVLDRHWGRS